MIKYYYEESQELSNEFDEDLAIAINTEEYNYIKFVYNNSSITGALIKTDEWLKESRIELDVLSETSCKLTDEEVVQVCKEFLDKEELTDIGFEILKTIH